MSKFPELQDLVWENPEKNKLSTLQLATSKLNEVLPNSTSHVCEHPERGV